MSGFGRLTCRVLTSLEEIDAVARDWQALEAASADPLSYFQSFAWCRNWVAQFCGDGVRPYIVTVWQGETVVAIWPQMIVFNAGVKRLETLGVPHSQYCGVLVRDRDDAQVRRALREAAEESGCDVVLTRSVLAGSPLQAVVGHMPQIAGSANVASMLDLSSFAHPDAYVAQLGKLQKRNRNRRRNHLARLGDLSFSVLWPGDPEFGALVRLCAEMKRRWLAETGRFSSGFAMRGLEDFLAALPGDRAALEGACLSVLRCGDRVVALELGFLRQGHYYAFVGGFDWELQQLSPGKVQMDFTVAWLIEQGVGSYDLLTNPANYKASWTNSSIAVSGHARALTWRGRLYASTWLPAVRPALKRLHARMPALVERIAVFLRPVACILLYV